MRWGLERFSGIVRDWSPRLAGRARRHEKKRLRAQSPSCRTASPRTSPPAASLLDAFSLLDIVDIAC
jgi:hypothetical protein